MFAVFVEPHTVLIDYNSNLLAAALATGSEGEGVSCLMLSESSLCSDLPRNFPFLLFNNTFHFSDLIQGLPKKSKTLISSSTCEAQTAAIQSNYPPNNQKLP